MITITDNYKRGKKHANSLNTLGFQYVFLKALKETGNDTRKCHINDKIAEYIKNKEVRFTGEIENNWQTSTGYCKSDLQNRKVINKRKEGNNVYWHIINEVN